MINSFYKWKTFCSFLIRHSYLLSFYLFSVFFKFGILNDLYPSTKELILHLKIQGPVFYELQITLLYKFNERNSFFTMHHKYKTNSCHKNITIWDCMLH